jgi:hypothetical protein
MNRKTPPIAAALMLALPLAAQASFSTVSNYTSAAQNPLLGLGPSWLENFEDKPVAGYAVSAGTVRGPGFSTDSVDADDGSIDGLGRQGKLCKTPRHPDWCEA